MKVRVVAEIEKNQDNFNLLIKKTRNLRIRLQNQENELLKPSLEIEELIKKENEAIQLNDFDEAQNIEVKLEDCRKQVEKINSLVEESRKEMTKLREQELDLLNSKQRLLSEAADSYSKAKQVCEIEMESYLNNDVNKHKNENIKIKKFREKLDFLKSNLDSDKTVKFKSNIYISILTKRKKK